MVGVGEATPFLGFLASLTKNALSNGGIALVPSRLTSAISSAVGGTHVLIRIVPWLVSPLVKILSIREATAVCLGPTIGLAQLTVPARTICENRQHVKVANATRPAQLILPWSVGKQDLYQKWCNCRGRGRS